MDGAAAPQASLVCDGYDQPPPTKRQAATRWERSCMAEVTRAPAPCVCEALQPTTVLSAPGRSVTVTSCIRVVYPRLYLHPGRWIARVHVELRRIQEATTSPAWHLAGLHLERSVGACGGPCAAHRSANVGCGYTRSAQHDGAACSQRLRATSSSHQLFCPQRARAARTVYTNRRKARGCGSEAIYRGAYTRVGYTRHDTRPRRADVTIFSV